jgi:hypothetical protein
VLVYFQVRKVCFYSSFKIHYKCNKGELFFKPKRTEKKLFQPTKQLAGKASWAASQSAWQCANQPAKQPACQVF